MQRDYREYVKSAFEPLCRTAGRMDLLSDLHTKDLPADRKRERFRIFSDMRVDPDRALPIPGGGFIAATRDGADTLLLICAPSLATYEIEALTEFCQQQLDLDSIEYCEAIFLVCVHELKNFIRLRDVYRTKERALDLIGIADDDEYAGHEVSDLSECFHEILVFRSSDDSSILDGGISNIALQIIINNRGLQSPIIDDFSSERISELYGKVGCSSDNLFQALTASHWRHVFLDIYRCVESLFFFPWMRELKRDLHAAVDLVTLHDRCRHLLKWHATERASMEKLFGLIDNEALTAAKSRVRQFSSDATAGAITTKVYEARNRIVHHEDRRVPNAAPPTLQDCRELSLYLCEFLLHFHDRFEGDLV